MATARAVDIHTESSMTDRINTFIESHPDGWNHGQWLELLSELENDGVDVSEPAVVGLALERERMAWELQSLSVQGLGPKRIQTLVETFNTSWNLRHATATEIAASKTIPQALADKVFEALHPAN